MSINTTTTDAILNPGLVSTNPPNQIIAYRNPLPTDINANIGDEWINKATTPAYTIWKLNYLFGGIANWEILIGPVGELLTLTGNTGGAISPVSGNINVIGDGTTISVAGSTGTLTISAINTGVLETLTGDSGGAIAPVSGNITLTGGTTGLTLAGTAGTLTLGGTLILANGGTSASLTASNGGIFYSTASAGAILAGTATARQMLQSGSSTTPAWSTTTWPATTFINTILYSSSASIIGQIAAASDGVLISGTGGIPSWLAAGTTGQILTATTGSPPSWASPAASSISITGDSGGALVGAAFTFTGSSTGLTFTGSGSTETLGGILVGANGGTGASNVTTSTGTFLRSNGTAFVTSTLTIPNTTTANQILYSSSNSIIGQIAAANNGVLISGTTGIPSFLAAGTTGQVLVATTSNPASWGTLSSIAVTSISGTAHQITASASTGAVTLSLPTQVEINTSTLQADASLALGANMYIAQGQIYAFRNDGTNGNTYWMGFPSGSQSIAINVAADPSTLRAVGITTSSDGTIGGTLTEGLIFIPLRGAVQYGTLGAGIQSYDSNASALADILAFYTNNAEHMRLTAGGALGINDIAPGTNALLSVCGGAQIGFSSGTGSIANGLLVSGNIGVGLSNPNSNVKVFIGGSVPTTNANTISIYVDQTLQTTGTGQYLCFAANPNTVASNFTAANIFYFNASQGTFANIGAGGAVTNQVGYHVSSGVTGAVTNYAFQGEIGASSSANWNCYMSGSAPNYMNGGLTIGSTSAPPTNGLYVSGIVSLGTGTTGSTTVVLGTNSPATLATTAPYTWFTMLAPDGTTVYVPGWK